MSWEETVSDVLALWMRLLDEAWARAGGVKPYRPSRLAGRVVASNLPAGQVATTVHRGPDGGPDSAHRAVRDWCVGQGIPTGRAVHGARCGDPAGLTTEVDRLLS